MAKMAGADRPRRARRTFSEEFKAGAVRLVLEEGKSIPKVALELDLTESALRGWVERAKADRGKGKPGALTTVEREELARLRKENRELKLKFEIVKKGFIREFRGTHCGS
jgi:transposase